MGKGAGTSGDENGMSVSLLSPGEDGPLDLGEVDFETAESEGYDLDDALDMVGTGMFQYRVVFLVALAWANNGLATMVTPFFMSGMRADMGLEPLQEGIVAAAMLFGMILGNFCIGVLADLIGRKQCIVFSILGVGVTTGVAYFGVAWWHVFLARVGVGLCVSGSMVPSNSLMSEILPRDCRGRWLAGLHIFWQCGTVIMVAITTELSGRKEWRELMLASGAPSVIIFLLMLCIGVPESPRFLLLMKRREECLEVLEEMARLNGAALPRDTTLQDVPPHPKVQPLSHVVGPTLFARSTLPLWIMFFWLNYASYGNVMWIKAYFGRMEMDSVERDVF